MSGEKTIESHKERVQEYVREQIPALKKLGEGCVVTTTRKGRVEMPSKFHVHNGVYGASHRVTDFAISVEAPLVKDWVDAGFYKIIGHPIQLHHYLAVLGGRYVLDTDGCLYRGEDYNEAFDMPDCVMNFSLTDGQPATEEDWKIMSNILGL